jgi:hypothetical protein
MRRLLIVFGLLVFSGCTSRATLNNVCLFTPCQEWAAHPREEIIRDPSAELGLVLDAAKWTCIYDHAQGCDVCRNTSRGEAAIGVAILTPGQSQVLKKPFGPGDSVALCGPSPQTAL